VSTRDELPVWVEKREGYSGQVFLHGVMLGFTRGQWPVQAFAADPDGGCTAGAFWAAQKPQDRVLVGPVVIPDDIPVLHSRHTPARYELSTGGN
jgi:hypothetical protein